METATSMETATIDSIAPAAETTNLPKTKFVPDADQPKGQCPRCLRYELIVGDLGDRPLQRCGGCHGVFVSADTINMFKPSSARQVAGEIVFDGVFQVGFEALGDVVIWIVEGVFDGL